MPFVLAVAFISGVSVWQSLKYLHMFQLESYQFPGFFRWMHENLLHEIFYPSAISICGTVILLILQLTLPSPQIIQFIIVMLACALLCIPAYRNFLSMKDAKKPLNYTARVKRLLACLIVLTVIVTVILFILYPPMQLLPLLLLPVIFLAAAYITHPVEEQIKLIYFKDAQRKLASFKNIKKIGVTGSYGKTSVKFCLEAILSMKYQTLVTPSSFNTPMGVTRVIREQLMPTHQVFVAEMGARHVGDIAELVELVHPEIGIITSVGPQHLETFGNIENIAKTKYELIEGLPEDGMAFFASDGGICDELYAKTRIKKYKAGFSEDCDMRADDIKVTSRGSTFTLITSGGESIMCKTSLLGRHNIHNIVLGACVAHALGVSLTAIARAIRMIKPVENRLQIIPTNNGITVINDAFNSNPVSARAALAVLSAFESGKKIIVTPGFVEQGEGEAAANKAFGMDIARNADIAVLVGKKRSQPIYEGLTEAGFAQDKIYVVDSIGDTRSILAMCARPGDVVLYENDLPDNY